LNEIARIATAAKIARIERRKLTACRRKCLHSQFIRAIK